jgi:hypothetical protein
MPILAYNNYNNWGWQCEAEFKKWMCYIDGQKNKYSVLNECNRMLKYNIVTLIYHRHKPTDSINLLGSQRGRNVFLVRYGVELSFK